MNHIIHCIENRYSHPTKLFKIFASLLRIIDKWKKKANIKIERQHADYELLGKNIVIHLIRLHFFPQELKKLTKGKEVSLSSSIKQLSPFLDNYGIMRTRGRIGECESLTYENKHQIIMPKCQFVYNLIRQIHLDNLHSIKLL